MLESLALSAIYFLDKQASTSRKKFTTPSTTLTTIQQAQKNSHSFRKSFMSNLFSLRLYFPQSARTKPTRLWHHISAPALSHRLLLSARKSHIEQVILHNVSAGYLNGNKLSRQQIELQDAKHPACLELMDTEDKLRKFVLDHKDELHNVKAALFQCEILLP
jgi:PII-like signaling protein